jgi:hypothetical protein
MPGGKTRSFTTLALLASFALGLGGCRQKATPQQCGEMLDRFAHLVVKERFPDAGAEVLEAERLRERRAAKSDDAFKSCPSEVQASELECAMRAETSQALLTCLE